MTLKEQINEDIKTAMKAQEKSTLTALREIKSLILLEETKGGATENITPANEIALLTKALKQRKESFDMFKNGGRDEQAAEQLAVMHVIEKYLPKQLSPEEAEAKIKAIITDTNATIKEMGKVIGLANKEMAGQFEGKLISEMVKKLLS